MSKDEISRREALAAGLSSVAGIAGGRFGLIASAFKPADRRYLNAAKRAGAWLRAQAIEDGSALLWQPTPGTDSKPGADLYSGVPGVALFLAEAWHATEDDRYARDLKRATAGLKKLAEDAPFSAGLYEGQCGVGFALLQAARVTRSRADRDAGDACFKRVAERAREVGKGVDWDGGNDVISGAAGVGLSLIWAATALKQPRYLALARRVGDRLIEVGQTDKGGLKWGIDDKFPRLMPNFSHGTAGVSYFLARLAQASGEKGYMQAAMSGANYLRAIAKTDGEQCLIFHHEPGGEDLYYLGWCHGPAGTARLFYALHQATRDEVWLDWVHRSAAAVMASGIPEKQTPGFWNNVGICCGTAGVADFFLSLYGATRRKAYLDFCNRLTDSLLAQATEDSSGLRWIHAENRVSPDHVAAQTGLMQGAAGIGLYLLRRDAFERGLKPAITLPDSPF